MTGDVKVYETKAIMTSDYLGFLFVSSAQKDIIKVIQYVYVQMMNGKKLYNLGFGDYDMEKRTLNDTVITGNGDERMVFYTVLNTIPVFFKYFPGHMLIVQGSDSTSAFKNNCRKTCQRNCKGEQCRKADRRIGIYRNFVNRNFKTLNADYQFFWRI